MPQTNSTSQADTNKATSQSVSDDTVKAFLGVPDDKKREYLGKMSSQAKQSLLMGIKTYKAKGMSLTPPAQPDIISAMKGMIEQKPPQVTPQQPSQTAPQATPQIAQPTAASKPTDAPLSPFSQRMADPKAAAPVEDPTGLFPQIKGSVSDAFSNIKGALESTGSMAKMFEDTITLNPQGALMKGTLGKDAKAQASQVGEGFHKAWQASVDSMKRGEYAEGIQRTAGMIAPLIGAAITGGATGNPAVAVATLAAETAFLAPMFDRSYDLAKEGQPIRAAGGLLLTLKAPEMAIKGASRGSDIVESVTKGSKVIQDARATRVNSYAVSKGALMKASGDIWRRVGTLVDAIQQKDIATNPQGVIDPALWLKTLDDMKSAKAGKKMTGGELSSTTNAMKLIKNRGKSMTWQDAKQLRTSIYEMNSTGVDRAILSDFDKFAAKQLGDRSKAIGMGAQHEAYTDLASKLSEHKNGLFGDLVGTETDQQFFDRLSKAHGTSELAQLNLDLQDLGLPAGYLTKLMDSHRMIHRVATAAGKGIEGFAQSKYTAVKQHPIAAGTAATGAFATAPGFGAKIMASMMAASYAAEIANRVGAIEEMRTLGGPPKQPSVGKLGKSLNTPTGGAGGSVKTPIKPTPPTQPPTPLGMSPVTGPAAASPSSTPQTTGGTTASVPPVGSSQPAAVSPVAQAIVEEGRRHIAEISNEAKEAQVKAESKTPTVTKVPEGESGTNKALNRAEKARERTAKNRAKKTPEGTVKTGGDAGLKAAEGVAARSFTTSKSGEPLNIVDLEDMLKGHLKDEHGKVSPGFKQVLKQFRNSTGGDDDLYKGKLIELLEKFEQAKPKKN